MNFLHLINTIVIIYLITIITQCNGHGRLIEPPSRASAWRFGFPTPHNYNDHELYCGGFARQWNKNNGKCGECGDAYDMPKPRPNEYGGAYGLGVNVRSYKPGSKIEIKIDLTASHNGYFEFRLCPFINATEECFHEHQIQLMSDYNSVKNLRFYPERGGAIYTMYGILPADLTCNQCVLQWRYVAGNNWGTCKNGSGAVGCGPQEEFRACADISITVNGTYTLVPPTTTDGTFIDTNEIGDGSEEDTAANNKDEKFLNNNNNNNNNEIIEEEVNRFVLSGLFIIIFAFVFVVFIFALLYICYYEDRIKKLLERNR